MKQMNKKVIEKKNSYRESFLRIYFDHSSEKVLTIWRDKVRNVELSSFHFFQKVPQVVVVEGQRAHQEGVEDDPARPNVGLSAVVFLALAIFNVLVKLLIV